MKNIFNKTEFRRLYEEDKWSPFQPSSLWCYRAEPRQQIPINIRPVMELLITNVEIYRVWCIRCFTIPLAAGRKIFVSIGTFIKRILLSTIKPTYQNMWSKHIDIWDYLISRTIYNYTHIGITIESEEPIGAYWRLSIKMIVCSIDPPGGPQYKKMLIVTSLYQCHRRAACGLHHDLLKQHQDGSLFGNEIP